MRDDKSTYLQFVLVHYCGTFVLEYQAHLQFHPFHLFVEMYFDKSLSTICNIVLIQYYIKHVRIMFTSHAHLLFN